MNRSTKPLLPLVLADVPWSLRRVLAQEGISTLDFATSSAAGRFVLYDSRRGPPPRIESDQRLVDVDQLRQPNYDDCFAKLDDVTTCRSVWQVARWEASEEIAAVDRAEVRATVVTGLRRLLESLGGVWIGIGPVPFPYRTVFNFRFDHDAFVSDDFNAVMDAVAGREAMTTHFVCAAPHEPYADALRRLDGCDVGSHGYRHHTYDDAQVNIRNITRGVETLQQLGFEPSGFAAPHGRYHFGVAEALATCGITHSSEFAAGYDDWPFFPYGSDVLQLPIHPVCLGIVLEAAERVSPDDESVRRRAADDVANYFVEVANAKRDVRAPILLYGHPDGRLGRYPHVLRDVLQVAEGWSDVWKTNYTELQRWWRARAAVRVTVHEVESGYQVRVDELPKNHTCKLEWSNADGTAAVSLDRPLLELRREALPFEPRSTARLPRPVRREPLRGLKERLRRAIDWEYVTPLGEIDVHCWRGRLKRTLRRWKGRVA